MNKAVIGTLLGAVVWFAWGFISWMILPWHNATVKTIPQEQLVVDTLKTVIKEPGFYPFPHDMNAPDAAAWRDRAQRGPTGVVIFSPAGKTPMDPMTFVREVVAGLFVSALLMWVFWASRLKKAVHRIHLAAAVGLMAGFAVHWSYWNWFSFPGAVTALGFIDHTIVFALVGATLHKFVPEA